MTREIISQKLKFFCTACRKLMCAVPQPSQLSEKIKTISIIFKVTKKNTLPAKEGFLTTSAPKHQLTPGNA